MTHHAYYDTEGNIILPSEAIERQIVRQEAPKQAKKIEAAVEKKSASATPLFDEKMLREMRRQMRGVMFSAIAEGLRQYRASFRDGRTVWSELKRGGRSGWTFTKAFLAQPVWIPGRNRTVKQYNRGTLFALDIVRFGSTFACIFLFLFLALNYQSFWQIMRSKIDPLKFDSAGGSSGIDTALREKLKRVPGLAVSGTDGDLLSFLPEVGPPDNRIIIPKLNLNVPLVTPSYASLLKEDWTQVEQDIQAALQGGVVHYPGTARPGQAGNFFVTGHSSYYPWAPGNYKTVFARLHQLQVGDEYWVYFSGDKHRYTVIEKKEVKPSDITVLDQPTAQRIATLMTCTPVGTTLRRLILVSQEVDPITGVALKIGEKGERIASPVQRVPLEALPI
ncbi:sortase [Candidatus Peregrinibacteria bacterium]|nr:sortase [Candidatus Peregrinibacteria bacterium]